MPVPQAITAHISESKVVKSNRVNIKVHLFNQSADGAIMCVNGIEEY